MAETTNWHAQTVEATLQELHTTLEGLAPDQVETARQTFGSNALPPPHTRNPVQVFFDQFRSALIYILVVAGLISLLVQAWRDAAVIFGVVILNAIIGYRQERQATSAMSALLRLSPQDVNVFRGGQEHRIPIEAVVVGDIVTLATGDQVPADGRWVETLNLRLNEASLTGESAPVNKTIDAQAAHTPIQDQRNMGWRGTIVVAGRGRLLVTATGGRTRFGSIVVSLQSVSDGETPFQKKLASFSRRLAIAVLIMGLAVFLVGIARDFPFEAMFLLAVSLIVSIIPEGLPVVMTIAMAYGMWAMAKRHAIVRKLVAVETLGAVTVVATDKTGTLTYGQMMLEKAWVDGRSFHLTGEGYRPEGDVFLDDKKISPREQPGLSLLLRLGALNNDARFTTGQHDERIPIGDPTELALVVAAEKSGWQKAELEATHPRLGEFPFDYKKKYMVTWHQDEHDQRLVIIKGAPQAILAVCSQRWHGGGYLPLGDADRAAVMETYERWAGEALRGLAIAYIRRGSQDTFQSMEALAGQFTFVGLVGIQDALRPEAKQTIQIMRQAGIRTIMLTGDFLQTGRAVAERIDLLKGAGPEALLDGAEVDGMDDEQLRKRLPRVRVGTRLTPEHKLRIATALKQTGEIVAMTGDGINDVPALTTADVGIAVGRDSSDAAKEAADVVLVDGNYAVITTAIAEGRRIFRNIRRVMYYLLASNFGELILIGGAMLGGLPVPLLPTQIIWLNAITDPFLGIALAREPQSPTVMQEQPQDPQAPIIRQTVWIRIIITAMTVGLSGFAVFLYAQASGRTETHVYALTLTAIALAQWFTAFTSRSSRRSMFALPVSRAMVGALATVVIMHVAILYVPLLAQLFQVAPLTPVEWLIAISAGIPVVVVEELRKWIIRSGWFGVIRRPRTA